MLIPNPLKNKHRKKSESEIGQYISQFNTFLNRVEGKNSIPSNRREDPLGDMLLWAEKILRDKSQVENNIKIQGEQIHRADEKIEEMSKVIEQLKKERSKLEQERSRLEQEREKKTSDHKLELLAIAQQHSLKIQSEENIRKSQKEEFKNEKERLKIEHTGEVEKLLSQLLVNQKDDQGWPDDKMNIKFRELQRLMESVTAPQNREFLIPSGQKLPSHLDPTNFLGRAGTGKSHFLLKSILWAIIQEQFFSAPLGFGVLGPRRSQRALLEMYIAWRKLFDANIVSTSPDVENYAIFRQDSYANNWRSATFQYIGVALKTPEQSHSPINKLNIKNFNDTINRIHTVLSEIAGMSDASIRPEIQDQVFQMVVLGRDIALQFGIQTAQLQLFVPKHDEKITIGEMFHDCEDGDSFRGKIYNVDLVTTPGILKIGDGRSDMNSERAIVPCEIYPIETDT